MSLRFLVVAITCLCLGVGTIWFLSHFERRTEKEWTGFQGKARRDPWLAAERLVQRMGGSAAAVHVLDTDTLPRTATLLMPGGRLALDARSRERVLAWVRRGGRLVVAAEPPYMRDPLLDALGVRRQAVNPAAPPKEAGGAHEDAREEKTRRDDFRMPVSITLPPDLPPVIVRMRRAIHLQARNPLARFGNDGTITALLLAHGNGRVLVLNGFDAFTNFSIGEEDHAEFLWRVVQVDGMRPSAFFFSDPHKLSLVEWFRDNAWTAVAGAGLLLLAWLWRNAPRFGPVVPDPDRARRRLLDHLRASGRFLWKHGGSQRLTDAAREACVRRVLRTYPELLGVAEADREAHVAELLGLDAGQSRLLFSREAPPRALDFIRTIQVFQAVHESLALRRAGDSRTARQQGEKP